jgi:hypothetical protein
MAPEDKKQDKKQTTITARAIRTLIAFSPQVRNIIMLNALCRSLLLLMPGWLLERKKIPQPVCPTKCPTFDGKILDKVICLGA